MWRLILFAVVIVTNLNNGDSDDDDDDADDGIRPQSIDLSLTSLLCILSH